MKARLLSSLAALALTTVLVGCQGGATNSPPKGPDPKGSPKDEGAAVIKANLDKLNPEDRRLADAQGFCAVETKNPLGSMGVPVKIEVQGQPVFLCCDGCETRAKAHADRTLAKVQELKEKRAATPGK